MVLVEDLRQAVLQAALRGKLTEQLETDNDVDEMLISIQKEKEKLVADKKIKKEKPLPEILKEDIPFDIPENWRWVRLGDVVRAISAGGDKPKDFSKEKTSLFSIPVIANGETNNGILGYTNKAVIKEKSLTISGRGTIGFSMIRTEPYVPIVRLLVVMPLEKTNLYYIQCVLRSLIEMGIGTAVKQLTVPMIQSKIIPFPPIEEQQRIVDKMDEIMPKIDEYEKIEKELEGLKEKFPNNMKDALLQAAMQGKLTEQMESDSSVDNLLEEIRKEKEKLVLQKKIKREKSLPEIEEEEIPFDIPENWRWVRWGNLAYSIQYGYNAPAQELGKIKMVRISDIQNNLVNWDSVPYCDIPDEEIETYILKENDILFARTGGTVGKSFLVNSVLEDAIYAGYLIRTRYNNQLVPRYLKLFMESQLYWVQLQNGKTQGCQPNCNGRTLSKIMIPLPPIEEQQRIVERLDTLLSLCEGLKE